jgi:hypothetical protein
MYLQFCLSSYFRLKLMLIFPILIGFAAPVSADTARPITNQNIPNSSAPLPGQAAQPEEFIEPKPDHIRPDGAREFRGRIEGKGNIKDKGTHIYEGVIAPGHSPGCISDAGNVILSGNATLQIEIGGTAVCSGFDQFTVQQGLTINGAKLQVSLINSFLPTTGQRFKVLQWGTLTGNFATVDFSLAALPPGYSWNTTSLYTSGELIVNGPPLASTSVPIPGWALLSMAAGLLVVVRKANNRA